MSFQFSKLLLESNGDTPRKTDGHDEYVFIFVLYGPTREETKVKGNN